MTSKIELEIKEIINNNIIKKEEIIKYSEADKMFSLLIEKGLANKRKNQINPFHWTQHYLFNK